MKSCIGFATIFLGLPGRLFVICASSKLFLVVGGCANLPFSVIPFTFLGRPGLRFSTVGISFRILCESDRITVFSLARSGGGKLSVGSCNTDPSFGSTCDSGIRSVLCLLSGGGGASSESKMAASVGPTNGSERTSSVCL